MKSYWIIITGILLCLAVIGTAVSFSLKEPKPVQAAGLNYQQTGKFDYLAYLKPSYLYGPTPQPSPAGSPVPLADLKYPVAYADYFQFVFAYSFLPSDPVKSVTENVTVAAVGKNSAGKDVKSVLLPPTAMTGDFTTGFNLPVTPDISGNDITVNIDVYPTIQTGSGTVFESFEQSVIIKSDGTILEVKRDTLSQAQTAYLGSLGYQQTGNVNLALVTKADSPLGVVTVRPPAVPSPSPLPATTLGPGNTLFIKLTDRIAGNFNYQFQADGQVRNLALTAGINAVLTGTKSWSKTIVLAPPTTETGNFSLPFSLDVDQVNALLQDINAETGVPAGSYNLAIEADVHLSGQTDYGPLSGTFSPTLTSALDKGTISWNEDLSQSKNGSVAAPAVVPAASARYLGLSLGALRGLIAALLVIFLLGFAFCCWMYLRRKPGFVDAAEQEVLRINKKYGQRITQSRGQAPSADERVVEMNSIDDLMAAADELGKPAVHQPPANLNGAHYYYTIDGITRYQYQLAPDGRGNPGRNKNPAVAKAPED